LVDPQRFTQRIVECCQSAGARIYEGVKVAALSQNSDGIEVVSERDGMRFVIDAKVVVNVAGPWSQQIQKNCSAALTGVQWCRAFNLVIDREIDHHHAIAMRSPKGRLFFAVPRSGMTAIGTFYLPLYSEVERAGISQDEVALFIEEINQAFPGLAVGFHNIAAMDLGVIPTRRITKFEPKFFGASPIYSNGRYIELLTTKYTTFRTQARRVMRIANKLLKAEPAPAVSEVRA